MHLQSIASSMHFTTNLHPHKFLLNFSFLLFKAQYSIGSPLAGEEAFFSSVLLLTFFKITSTSANPNQTAAN
jgi:hypothetical protein